MSEQKRGNDLKSIGKRVQALRMALGMTQEQLSEKLFVSREWVNKIERGAGDMKTGSIIALAEALRTTCDYLLLGVQSENVDICRETGLEDASIEALKRYKAQGVEGKKGLREAEKARSAFWEKVNMKHYEELTEQERIEIEVIQDTEVYTFSRSYFWDIARFFINEFIQSEALLRSISDYSGGILECMDEPNSEEKTIASAGSRFILSKQFDDFLMNAFKKGENAICTEEEI